MRTLVGKLNVCIYAVSIYKNVDKEEQAFLSISRYYNKFMNFICCLTTKLNKNTFCLLPKLDIL